MKNNILSVALKITAPVFFGYIAIGIGFGILLANAGYPWWLAPVMCLTMYTGSGQYFAVGQLSCGATLAEIMLVQLLLSIRHIFYGLSLISKYKGTGKIKPYLIFAITDETFAIIQGIEVPANVNKTKFYFLISILDQCYWTIGSTLGAVGYKVMEHYNLSQYLQGIDFALTSLFVVLLIEQVKSSKDFIPGLIGLISGALCVILCLAGIFQSSSIIWTAICIGLGTLLLIRGPEFFKKKQESLK